MDETRGTRRPLALVVDPDDQFRGLLAGMLAGAADTVGAADVTEAAALLRRARPDVVVVDPRHLRLDLPTLVDLLEGRVPVLACTAAPLRPREVERLRLDAVLPYRLLSRSRLSRELTRLCAGPAARRTRRAPAVAVPPARAVPYRVAG